MVCKVSECALVGTGAYGVRLEMETVGTHAEETGVTENPPSLAGSPSGPLAMPFQGSSHH